MLAIASDHGGFALKQAIMAHLTKRGIEYHDYGTYSEASCDYPDFGKAAALAVAGGECDRGIVPTCWPWAAAWWVRAWP